MKKLEWLSQMIGRAMDERQEEAFELAGANIAEAKKSACRDLSLEDIDYLTTLPPQISGLTSLRRLSLDYTEVADITPLAGLTALNSLSLANTQIADVTPLVGLSERSCKIKLA